MHLHVHTMTYKHIYIDVDVHVYMNMCRAGIGKPANSKDVGLINTCFAILQVNVGTSINLL